MVIKFRTVKYYLLLLCCPLLLACSSTSLKYATLHVFAQQLILLAFFLIALRAYCYQKVLKYIDLSTANCGMALGPIFILVIGLILFHEGVTFFNLLGTLLIVSGLFTVIISKSMVRK